jgi:uncharacterized protein YqeY
MSLYERLKADLPQRMKTRERAAVNVIRSLIAALDNAGAIELDPSLEPSVGRTNDQPRRLLTDHEVHQIVQREAQEHRDAIAKYERLGLREEAARLSIELEVINHYLTTSTGGTTQ